MRKIRVVQYGTWKYTHAEHTMLTMRSLPQFYEVVGVCEPNPERQKVAEQAAGYQGLRWLTEEEILADRTLDAVIVETKETEQAAAALRFARAGFALHVDKPCGGEDEDFFALTREVRRQKLPFQVGYMYRYNPAVRRALEAVKTGRLGDILAVELQMSQCYHGEMLRFLGDLPGGMMYYLGCHLADLAILIQGEPQEVLSLNQASDTEEKGITDFGFALLRYAHGQSFIKTVACEVNGDIRRQLVISGTKGTLEIKPLENPIDIPGLVCPNKIGYTVTSPLPFVPFDQRIERVDLPPYGRYNDMMLDFAAIVTGKKENEFTVDHEESVYRLITKLCPKRSKENAL